MAPFERQIKLFELPGSPSGRGEDLPGTVLRECLCSSTPHPKKLGPIAPLCAIKACRLECPPLWEMSPPAAWRIKVDKALGDGSACRGGGGKDPVTAAGHAAIFSGP